MLSIKSKVVLFVVSVSAILPAFSLYFVRGHYLLGERAAGNIEETFRVLNETLVQDFKNAMLANQMPGIQKSMLNIRTFKQVRSAALLDSEGRVVMAQDGVFIQKNNRKKVGSVGAHILTDVFKKPKVWLDIHKASDVLSYQYLVPFRNEKACQKCHNPRVKTNGVLVLQFQVPDMRKQTYWLTLSTFGFYAAGLAGASFLLLLLMQNIVIKPLNALQDAMQNVAGGELNVKVPVSNQDEIGKLSNYFNDMVQNLKQLQEALAKNVEEKEKAKFLAEIGMMASKVAHEVRNPLNVLEGVAYYFKKAYSGEQDIVEHASLIQNKVKHLERFSNDLLLYAKPEQLNREDGDVNLIIKRKVSEFLQFNNEKKVQVALLLEPALEPLPMDILKMNEALENLLQNAVDASLEGAEITVSTRRKNSVVTVSVKDHGAGIPETQKENLFKPFFSTKKHGTGLGLCIVKKIVEAHGGEIKIVSDENKGTEVQIIFKGGSS